jgi:glycosyltransferase involved in cell wall biosynthesis
VSGVSGLIGRNDALADRLGRLTGRTFGGPHLGVTAIEPGPDDVVVVGWAAYNGKPLSTIVLRTDHHVVGAAQVGEATPQAAVDAGDVTVPDAGWRATIRRDEFGVGVHRLSAQAILPGNRVETVGPLAFELTSRVKLGSIDLPAEHSSIDGRFLTVRGWFRSLQGFDRVDLYLGDRFAGRARILAQPRGDLPFFISDADAGIAGFEAWLDLDGIEPGPVELRADAVSDTERVTMERVSFIVTGRQKERPLTDPAAARAETLFERTAAAVTSIVPAADDPQRPIDVLIATHHLGIGGGQLYLHELMLRMLERPGLRFRVLAGADGPLRDELEALGIEVQIIGSAPVVASEYEQWLRGVASVIRDHSVDAVIANTAGCFWGIDLASRIGVPSIWAVHESFPADLFLEVGMPNGVDAYLRERFLGAFHDAGAVVFEADATLDLFTDLVQPGHAVRVDYGVDLEAVERARAGADPDRARRSVDIPRDATVLLCVGTYEARKAQALLTVAFTRLAADYPHAFLALVGNNQSPYAETVVELVEKLGVQEQVLCVPTTPDIEDWYALADAFILASDVESLPRSMIEAMAFELPIIGTDVFGVGELVEDGETGILFPPSSIADVEAALRRFLDLDSAERSRMGRAAAEVVTGTRSSQGYAEAYRALLDALVAAPDTRADSVVRDGRALER